MSPDTLTLDDALRVLSLPRLLGKDPEGVEIFAGPGRYGPYVRRGDDYRSLEDEDQIFTVTLDEALDAARGAEDPPAPGAGAAAARDGRRPDHREAAGDQGRPVRPVRDRRRDQRVAAARSDDRGADRRAGERDAGREAGQGPGRPRKKATKAAAKKAAPAEGDAAKKAAPRRPPPRRPSQEGRREEGPAKKAAPASDE